MNEDLTSMLAKEAADVRAEAYTAGFKTDLDELLKDKARLDWLDANISNISEIAGGVYPPSDIWAIFSDDHRLAEEHTIRAAIDAAMKQVPHG